LTIKGDTTLIASEKAQKRSNFADIAAQFDDVKTVSGTAQAERGTVVYVKDGGTGNGATPAQAVGTLLDAYESLDLSKACTIVICGTFTTPKERYTYPGAFGGSVTFTSVYDGTDYRKSGAKFVFMPYSYGCPCATTFENIDIVSGGTGSSGGVVYVAQFHPFTLGQGVTITGGSTLTGGKIANSFTIVGGYDNSIGEPPLYGTDDVNIKVLSGDKIYIVAYNRNMAGSHTGAANIYIGGTATVSTLHGSTASADGGTVGDVKVTLTDSANVGVFYGSTQTMTVNSFTLDWKSGTMGKFYWDCPYMKPVGKVTYANGTTLIASGTAKAAANYADIAAEFTKVENAGGTATPNVQTDYGCARGLFTLGLAQGYDTTGTNFGLTDKMTRVQTVVQVIRFLGKEAEVKAGSYKHPFDDIPAWADNYIGYAYENKITSGVSATKFNPDGETTEAQFLTFMLRAIGYSDAADDFAWDKPYTLAKSIGMTDSTTPAANFLRGGAFRISWNTLYATAKNSAPVYTNLINDGVFTATDLDKAASAALSAIEPAKPLSGANIKPVTKENGYYVLPVDTYLDKTLCGMLSQFAGVLTGYEFVYQNGVPRLNLPDEWFDFLNGPYAEANPHNRHEDKLRYDEDLGLWVVWIDDDYSIDFFDLFMMDDMYEKYGTFATKVITDSWIDYCIYDMGGGNHKQGAYKLAKLGYFAPFLGEREYGNMYSVFGEPLIENETLGMVTAGLPNAAVDLTGIFASVTSDRDPIRWAQFFSTMYALAYVESDMSTIVDLAKEVFPADSWERSVVDGCIEIHNTYPDSWRQAILECNDRFYRPQYDKENGNLSEASLFSSFMLTGLLYGDGDWMETLRILSLAGHGGESSSASALGIVGVMQGWENLQISPEDKEKMNTLLWQDGKGLIWNRSDPELKEGYWMHADNLEEYFKMPDLVRAFQRNFERVLLENGGKIENSNYYIPFTALKTQNAALIEDFESGLDAYKTEGSVTLSDNFYTGKYGAMLSGTDGKNSRIYRDLNGLTVGATYRVTANIRTSARTEARLYVRAGSASSYPYVTVYDETPFAKRTMIFTATAETMEFGLALPGETNAYKYAVIDDILIERVEETPASAKAQIVTAPDANGLYKGKVDINITGKESKEVYLKVTFANPSGQILNVPLTLNDDAKYGT
ncbi:MAG: S-layer homology domain-containing protein, partial [Clostridia bacterium]|nr:S-layer homology domain-containing protein [Clostridia bacterium]